MKKKKIGLVGYFGFGNFGDELFMDVHKQFLADDYELEVTLTSSSLTKTSSIFA